MSETHWTDRLSDYLDGQLPPVERNTLEAHLETCAECSNVLGELRAVVARTRELQDTAPQKDLWKGIERAIASLPQEDDQVIDFPAGVGSVDPLKDDGRIRLSLPQVAAASLILMLGSAAASWSLRPLANGSSADGDTAVPAVVQASLPDGVSESYAEELAQLEALLSAKTARPRPTYCSPLTTPVRRLRAAPVLAQHSKPRNRQRPSRS